uniref:Uncharacterized protein n=1 Tax=Anguilla anguilla TaxID=7936 RepID=A0A0E9TJI6_ANGAN
MPLWHGLDGGEDGPVASSTWTLSWIPVLLTRPPAPPMN